MGTKSVPRMGVGEKIVLGLILACLLYRYAGATVALCLLIPILSLQFLAWYRHWTLWQRVGVPYEPCWMVIGHTFQYMTKGSFNCDTKWMAKYGKIYGANLLSQHEIIVSDPELLKQVLVKDFNVFTNRRPNIGSKKNLNSRMITSMRDDEWKNTRSTVTPAFTSGKLKGALHLMETRIKTLCDVIGEQKDFENGTDVKRLMGNLTLDVIAAAAFAMDIDAQTNPDNEFAKHARLFVPKLWRITVMNAFPLTLKYLDELFGIRVFATTMQDFYAENLARIVKIRRQNPKAAKPDILQLLINVAYGEKEETEKDTSIDHGLEPSKKWALNQQDIIAQSFLFLFAGHETSATTLNFACYLLAWHPEAQEKCYQEVKNLINENEPIPYDTMQRGMPYTEAVISETLRLYPPAPRFDRHCEQDYQLTDTITIPKDTFVVVPVYAIHHHADNYEDPEKFDPERFLLPEKKSSNPFAFLPFGYGPRNCIGMRFAQMEMKLALGNVLRNFRIEPCSKTEPPPLQLDVSFLLRPKNPIHLNFKRR